MLGVSVVVGVVLIVLLVSGGRDKPAIARSCDTPALVLGRATTGDGRGITWAMTGPQAGAYAVTVDGRTIASPKLSNCTASGEIPPLVAGTHQVGLTRDGRSVASVPLRP